MSPAHVSAPLASQLPKQRQASPQHLGVARGAGLTPATALTWPHEVSGAAGCVQMFVRVLQPCISGPGHKKAGIFFG